MLGLLAKDFYRSGEGRVEGISSKNRMTVYPRSEVPLVCPETYVCEYEPLRLQLLLHSPPAITLK